MKGEQIFISLTVGVLNFLKKVEDRTIELYPGDGNQIGSIPILEFLDIIGIIVCCACLQTPMPLLCCRV